MVLKVTSIANATEMFGYVHQETATDLEWLEKDLALLPP